MAKNTKKPTTAASTSNQPATTQPSPTALKRYRVTWSDHESIVTAINDREAWAQFCDGIRKWPSPKAGKVECLGEAAA